MTTASVITATYNRAEVLPRAIDSVLDQTYDDIEYIIVDDGSTDNTEDVVRSYNDDRIVYIRQQNAGANAARNRGLEEATGEFISFLDSDDEYTRKRVETMVSVFESLDDSFGGVFHGFEVFEDGELETVNRKEERRYTFDDLTYRNHIGGFLSPMFRSDVFDMVGDLDEGMDSSQDYEFYLRVGDEFDFYGVDENLGRYYLTSDSISTNVNRKRKGQQQILEKYGDELHTRRIADQYYYLGKVLAENGQTSSARTKFIQSIKTYPQNPLYYYYLLASLFGKRGYDSADSFKHSVKMSILPVS